MEQPVFNSGNVTSHIVIDPDVVHIKYKNLDVCTLTEFLDILILDKIKEARRDATLVATLVYILGVITTLTII